MKYFTAKGVTMITIDDLRKIRRRRPVKKEQK